MDINKEQKMQKLFILVVGILLGIVFSFGQQWVSDLMRETPTEDTQQTETAPPTEIVNGRTTVNVTADGLSHPETTIPTGTVVTWVNRTDGPIQLAETVEEGQPAFASPVLEPDQSFSHEFNEAGTYDYQDLLNPDRSGSVVVGE